MIKITVPATSANMGPGFDSLGIAFDIHNNFYFEKIEEGLIIEGCDDRYKNEDNLVYRSMKKCFEKVGKDICGIKIVFDTQVPVSRGLGSSATCSVAGVMAGNYFCENVLNQDEILAIATEMEGHPDNVAPAMFGGMVVSANDEGSVMYSKVKIHEKFKFYVLIPDFELSTQESRQVLPKEIQYSDAVFNVGRTALMISALINGQEKLIKDSFKDKLHQPYRGKLIKGYDCLVQRLKSVPNTACFISGAGSTLGVISSLDNDSILGELQKAIVEMGNKWDIKSVEIDDDGAKMVEQ